MGIQHLKELRECVLYVLKMAILTDLRRTKPARENRLKLPIKTNDLSFLLLSRNLWDCVVGLV